MRLCKFDNCDKPHYGRGWCSAHYNQWRRGEEVRPVIKHLGLSERFWMNAIVRGGDECWGWRQKPHKDGYSILPFQGRSLRAHRVSYELHNGVIPAGLVVDHTCRNRSCVNPNHLQLVTAKQNSENTNKTSRGRTGVRGVTLRSNGMYRARAGHDGKVFHLGDFKTLQEAADAVSEGRNRYHSNNLVDREGTSD